VIRAAARGDRPRLVQGLRAGADIDHEVDGWTALACASNAGEPEIVELILALGAVPSPEALRAAVGARTPSSMGPLPNPEPGPADSAHTEIVRALLDAGADPDGGDVGPSPLLYAAWSGQVETTALLLARGAHADHGGRVRSVIVHLAQTVSPGTATDTQPETVSQILPVPTGEYVENVPPLVGAAWTGRIDIARQLLDAGADPNQAADEAFTALFAAAVRGDGAMVDLLLERGAATVPDVRPGVLGPAEAALLAGHVDLATRLASPGPVPQPAW
jgi:ankyrin repeat protein